MSSIRFTFVSALGLLYTLTGKVTAQISDLHSTGEVRCDDRHGNPIN